MKIRLHEIAKLVDGKIIGDENSIISGLAKIDEAKNGDLTFLYHPAYERYFQLTKASAILVKTGFDKTRDDIYYIEIEHPEKAFFTLIRNYLTPKFPLEGIDKTAFVHPAAVVGQGTAFGKNVIISSGCKIGDNVNECSADGILGVHLRLHLHKGKTLGAAGVAVFHERHSLDRASLGKQGLQVFFCGRVGQVAYVNFGLHRGSSVECIRGGHRIIRRSVSHA